MRHCPTLGPSLFYFSELVFRVRVRVYRVASFESESALFTFGKALKFASENLKDDLEVVLVAVTQNGEALEYASWPRLRANKEVVLVAVKNSGTALKYSSRNLKNDKEVVLAALEQNGIGPLYASDDLRADKEVVLEAVAQNTNSLYFASPDLREGGLRAYMDGLNLSHRSMLVFLLAARHCSSLNVFESYDGPVPPHARVSADECVLTKLSAHGRHFAIKSKRLIAAFAGIPVGRMLTTLNKALRH